MSAFIRCLRRNIPDNRYFQELEQLSISEQPGTNERINDLFDQHSTSLIADLLANPEHHKNYRKIAALLKDKNLLNTFQSSISTIQKIALLLKNDDFNEVERCSHMFNTGRFSDINLFNILQRFSSLKLPCDLEEIRKISNSTIKAHMMATIINRDSIPIKDLGLTKRELRQLGPLLTFLDSEDAFDSWSRKEIHAFLDTCSNLKFLRINSSKITRLPSLLNCQELDCSKCTKITRLPALPLCEMLQCLYCSNLATLPDLPLCKILYCSNAGLTYLPDLPLCEGLDCFSTNLTKLPPLPFCKELCVSYTKLTYLPDLPLCKVLSCFNCPKLTRLPALPLCESLSCSDCTLLTRLPALPLCEELNCSDCINLRQLPPLPFCVRINCSNCARLTRLPDLPMCHEITYSNCNLDENSIPVRLRPKPLFQMICLKTLNDDPLSILLKLEQPLIRQRMLLPIQFIELDGRIAEGLDRGGVFRIFVSRLMQSLISHSDEPKQLRFIETNSGLHMPVLDLKRDIGTQLRGFKILGALFVVCYEAALNAQSVTTGTCFDQKLFDVITSLSFDELCRIDANGKELSPHVKLRLMSLFSDLNLKEIIRLTFVPSKDLKRFQFERLREFATANIDEEEEKVPLNLHTNELEEIDELKSWIQAWVRNFLLNMEQDIDIWLPAVFIAKQMQELIGTDQGWENLRRIGASNLGKTIQGVVTKESILSAIEWNIGNRHLNPVKVEQTKKFMVKWINEGHLKDLENFNNFISGSPTINPSKKLTFQLYDTSAQRLPTTHSCSFEIDLPINYASYEGFKEKLELALANVNSLESSSLEIQ